MISKGVDWGELRRPVPDSPLAHTDGELRALVVAAQVTGLVLPAIGLLGGDLHRTLGGTNDPARLTRDEPIPHLPKRSRASPARCPRGTR